MIRNNLVFLYISYNDKDKAKCIPGYQWNKDMKMWSFPISQRARIYEIFPEFRERIESEWNRIVELGKIKKENEEMRFNNIRIEYEFKMNPYAHQKDMIKYGLIHNKYGFLCEMGTGKTKVIIDLACILKQQGKIDKCLIICPKTIIGNWCEEIQKNSAETYIRLLKKHSNLTINNFFAIINYEQVLTIGENSNLWNQFSMIVLDESSKIKSHKAKRSKLIVKIFQKSCYKYILSGTPVSQSPIDIYMQFKFLDPSYLHFKSFYSFRNYYCEMGGYLNYQVIGYNHLSELNYKIAQHSIQLKKEDCIDLPDKIYEKRLLDMSKELKDQYASMRKNLILEVDGEEKLNANIVLTKLLRLQQILSGVYLKEKNPKLDELMELLEGTNESIIIWCRFRDTMEMIYDKLNGNCSILHGDISNRDEQIKWFQSGKKRFFLGQINTGGFGITLTKATLVIYYENTFSLEDRLQSEARAHRIGQTNKVTYIDLLYDRTIDTKILKAIKDKQDIAKQLVSSFLGGEF